MTELGIDQELPNEPTTNARVRLTDNHHDNGHPRTIAGPSAGFVADHYPIAWRAAGAAIADAYQGFEGGTLDQSYQRRERKCDRFSAKREECR